MLYLLDANVLIDANRDYYPLGRVPEFWQWLVYLGTNDQVKVPLEIFEEIEEGKDELARWAGRAEVRDALLFDEAIDPTQVTRVLNEGYAPDLANDEVEKIGRDPFLIAYALVNPRDRSVVTTEVS